MSEVSADGATSGATVLGISVVDDQIASIVRDGQGNVLASNFVDLPESAPKAVESAIIELVGSVPIDVDQIGIAVSRDDVRSHLASTLSPSTTGRSWYDKVVVTDYPSALAEIACAHATRGGMVAVVDLGRDAAPSAGTTLAIVDTTSGAVLSTSKFTAGQLAPVTDPAGAERLATTVNKLPNGRNISSLIVVGAGAALPGIAPAFEYAAQRPVTVAESPVLAPAVGAADAAAVASSTGPVPVTSPSTGRRWWFVGAAIGAAVFLGAVGLTMAIAESTSAEPEPPVTVTATPPTQTVTADAVTVTETEVSVRESTTTVTSRPSTVTRTSTSTVTESAPADETVTETTTVISTTTVTARAEAAR